MSDVTAIVGTALWPIAHLVGEKYEQYTETQIRDEVLFSALILTTGLSMVGYRRQIVSPSTALMATGLIASFITGFTGERDRKSMNLSFAWAFAGYTAIMAGGLLFGVSLCGDRCSR